jgi:hypothetical protein
LRNGQLGVQGHDVVEVVAGILVFAFGIARRDPCREIAEGCGSFRTTRNDWETTT